MRRRRKMKVTQAFAVARPPEQVWAFFQDVFSVAQCLPGAELTGQDESGAYEGSLSAKLGPMTATFEGAATVVSDVDSMSARIEGKGVDKRGGSRGRAKVDYAVAAEGAGSKVTVDADIQLSGPAAQFGRTGLINEMAKRLIEDFVDCLEAKLEAETEEEAAVIEAGEVRGVALLIASLWAWLKRLLKPAS